MKGVSHAAVTVFHSPFFPFTVQVVYLDLWHNSENSQGTYINPTGLSDFTVTNNATF